MSKLFNYYSFDECQNDEHLFERLEQLVDLDKIHYVEEDNQLLKLRDIDLTDQEIIALCKFLDENNVYPYLGHEDDEEESDDDYDDYDEDSPTKKNNNRSDYDSDDDYN